LIKSIIFVTSPNTLSKNRH